MLKYKWKIVKETDYSGTWYLLYKKRFFFFWEYVCLYGTKERAEEAIAQYKAEGKEVVGYYE